MTTPENHEPNARSSSMAPKPSGLNARVALVLLLFLSSVSAGFLGGYFGGKSSSEDARRSQVVQRQIVDSESQLITQIASEVGPGVVSINVVADSLQDTFFGPRAVTQESAGTGFFLNADGIIITNRHVVPKEAKQVSVTMADGTELTDVSVIGRTADSDSLDVAFLKVNDKKGKDIKPVKLGDSTQVEVGDKVVAIGNALGQFQNTVTSGIISGYGRSVEAGDESGGSTETLQNLFQTDASINQGNSGGPLVNMNGEVIAINTAIAGDAENIGFAIPISDVQGVIASVLKNGKLQRPYLGIRYVTLTDDVAYQYNLNVKRGAYLAPTRGQTAILSGSPAEKAGLKEKDIITKAQDTPIDEKHSLSSILGRHSVGDKVTLSVVRDGKEMKIDVTLEAAPTN